MYRRGNWGWLTCPRPHKTLTAILWGLSHSQPEKIDFPSAPETLLHTNMISLLPEDFFMQMEIGDHTRLLKAPLSKSQVAWSQPSWQMMDTYSQTTFPVRIFTSAVAPVVGHRLWTLPHPGYNIPNSLTWWHIKDLAEGPISWELIPTCFPAQAPRVEPALSFKVPCRFWKVLTLELITGKSF